MLKIFKKDLTKISKLSQIEILPEEEKRVTQNLEKIIDWVEVLQEVDTDGVDFLGNVHESILVLEKDKIEMNNSKENILQNSANVKYDYFTVPKVIG